jgi:hypothetical protein
MGIDPGWALSGTWRTADHSSPDWLHSCGALSSKRAEQASIATLGSKEEKDTVTESPGLAGFGLAEIEKLGSCCNSPYVNGDVDPANSTPRVIASLDDAGRATITNATAETVNRRIHPPDLTSSSDV